MDLLTQFLSSYGVEIVCGFLGWFGITLLNYLSTHPELVTSHWAKKAIYHVISFVSFARSKGHGRLLKMPFWLEGPANGVEKKDDGPKDDGGIVRFDLLVRVFAASILWVVLSGLLVGCGSTLKVVNGINEATNALTKAVIPVWDDVCNDKAKDCNEAAKKWLSECKVNGFYYDEVRCLPINPENKDACPSETIKTKVTADSTACSTRAKELAGKWCPHLSSCQKSRNVYYHAANGVHTLCAGSAALVYIGDKDGAVTKLLAAKEQLKELYDIADNAGFMNPLKKKLQ